MYHNDYLYMSRHLSKILPSQLLLKHFQAPHTISDRLWTVYMGFKCTAEVSIDHVQRIQSLLPMIIYIMTLIE